MDLVGGLAPAPPPPPTLEEGVGTASLKLLRKVPKKPPAAATAALAGPFETLPPVLLAIGAVERGRRNEANPGEGNGLVLVVLVGVTSTAPGGGGGAGELERDAGGVVFGANICRREERKEPIPVAREAAPVLATSTPARRVVPMMGGARSSTAFGCCCCCDGELVAVPPPTFGAIDSPGVEAAI